MKLAKEGSKAFGLFNPKLLYKTIVDLIIRDPIFFKQEVPQQETTDIVVTVNNGNLPGDPNKITLLSTSPIMSTEYTIIYSDVTNDIIRLNAAPVSAIDYTLIFWK